MEDLINTTSLYKLKEDAIRVLRNNDKGCFISPSPRLYPHQWNWDSAFISIGLSHIDEERAQKEILSLVRGQWTNGMIPHIIFDSRLDKYSPGYEFWNTSQCPFAPMNVKTSGITQPPLLSSAVLMVFKNSKNRNRAMSFLRKVYPFLKKYHRFFLQHRDPLNEGLAYIIHPWESGLDDSPRWDEILSGIDTRSKFSELRFDTRIVSAEERPTDSEYEKYGHLVRLFGNACYDRDRILNESPFIVQTAMFNSILYDSCKSLKEIADLLDEDITEIDNWSDRIKNSINNKLWNDNLGRYCDYDFKNKRPIIKDTIASYMPLYGGIPTEDIARYLVDILSSPERYCPKDGYPLCSVSMNAPEFETKRYWRGPVWINTNWLLIKGLLRYDYYKVAMDLTQRTLDLVLKNGFYEYFNPFSGEGYGSADFSWTASLIIDLIESYCQY